MTEDEARVALSSLAYRSVLLAAVSKRAVALASEWAEQKRRKEDVAWSVLDEGALTTSSTMVTGFNVWPSEAESPRLLEYRAYVELALILARQLSDVMARAESRWTDDVLGCDLVEDPSFTLPGVDEGLRTRINKGSAAHLVVYNDPEGRRWRIPAIAEWAAGTMTQFEAKLRDAKPERADWYSAELEKYRAEMDLLE